MSTTPSPFVRLPDWPARYAAYLQARHAMPFQWGVHDCCQFSRGNIVALTGRDPAATWRLRPYKTARGALGQLRRLGGIEALPAKAGLVEITLAYAGRGDLALGEDPDDGELVLGVVTGARTAFPTRIGLVFSPTLSCKRAWRV